MNVKLSGVLSKFFRNPVSRIIFGLLFVALPIQAVQMLFKDLREVNGWQETDGYKLLANVLAIACGFLGYIVFVRLFEKRSPSEISLKGFVPEFGKGLVLGFLLFTMTFSGVSFMAHAVIAAKRGIQTESQGKKGFYYASGLMEGAETIGFFVLICLLPQFYAALAGVFGVLCLVTGAGRIGRALQDYA